MKRKLVERDEIKIMGLKIRTNNKIEFNPETSHISKLVNNYFTENLAHNIKHRISPNKTYSIYSEYESDESGEYSYFLGEEVSDFTHQDLSLFTALTIPKQRYLCFTTEKGALPDIIIQSWQSIWQMDEETLKGKRNYIADFEIFDERCKNPKDAEVDIFVGIK